MERRTPDEKAQTFSYFITHSLTVKHVALLTSYLPASSVPSSLSAVSGLTHSGTNDSLLLTCFQSRQIFTEGAYICYTHAVKMHKPDCSETCCILTAFHFGSGGNY